MTREEVAQYKARERERYSKRYKPTPSQEALYDFLTTGNNGGKFTKERPATQEEIIANVGRYEMANGKRVMVEPYYSANKTEWNNDLCRKIYTDFDSLAFSYEKDTILGRTDDYRYYAVQDLDEAKEMQEKYLKTIVLAGMRWGAIQRKVERAGQGKLLASTPNAHALTEDCKPFHDPLPAKREEDEKYYQPEITE